MRKTIRIIALLVFLVSVAGLLYYFIEGQIDRRHMAEVLALKGAKVETVEPVDADEPLTVLPEYAALLQENPDTIGWLTVDGTQIDNVVMYAPEEKDKYLHADFYGNYSSRGSLFVEEDCDILHSDNLVIYGHHMKDGTMFGTLMRYADESFYKEHKTFRFDTIYEKHTYEVIAAIKTAIPSEDDPEAFRYYDYVGENDKVGFDRYVDFIEENRLYDTDAQLSFGDKILTLSTCAYHTTDGRFIVVARRID